MQTKAETTATAPGKIILFGEHAVVYGRPAIAAPLSRLRAKAVVSAWDGRGVQLLAPDLGLAQRLDQADPDDAIALPVRLVQQQAGLTRLPDMTITVTSDIPIASGLGSGAAISAAIIRALAQYLGLEGRLSPAWVSDLTFEVEKIHHGTPSGIDNTVVAYERPVYFRREQPLNLIETFVVGRALNLLVGDTGVRSSTKVAVGDVRRQWLLETARFEKLFDGCGLLCEAARAAIEAGDLELVGRLMNDNHALLVAMTVSSPELEMLVSAARQAGALGAKLSGGGRGGNMIALVDDATAGTVHDALLAAGAGRVLHSSIEATSSSHI
ncbi:MAG: mevalonate kinase [Candidatus Promineifilaceae bacterium]